MKADNHHTLAGNVFDKYGSRNPIVQLMIGGFLRSLVDLIDRSGAKNIHEVGCGEGYLVRMLAERGLRVRGSDLSPTIIQRAREEAREAKLPIEVKAVSIYDLKPGPDSADLILCAEVLEHLEDPRAALMVLASLAEPWALLSVPREPIWRACNLARFRYVADFGNTPGHLQHWSKRDFLTLLEEFFEVVEVSSPFPWTMTLCKRRS